MQALTTAMGRRTTLAPQTWRTPTGALGLQIRSATLAEPIAVRRTETTSAAISRQTTDTLRQTETETPRRTSAKAIAIAFLVGALCGGIIAHRILT